MYVREGFPDKSDFVIVTVKSVQTYAVTVVLDEYNKDGIIYTSEIERKWVRNLKTYMKVGRKFVCKVMDVYPNKGHINLSLRRVGLGQERSKKAEWKNEKKSHDLLIAFGRQNKLNTDQIYNKIGNKILNKYDLIFPVIMEIAAGNNILKDLKIDNKLAKKFNEFIRKRISPQRAVIKGKLIISSEDSNGLNIIKNAIKEAEITANKEKVNLKIKYIGAPNYSLKISAQDMKFANRALERIYIIIKKSIGSAGDAEFKK